MAHTTQTTKRGSGNTKTPPVRARNWFFTLNNYTEQDIKDLQEMKSGEYLFQEEKGKNGTPHLQGIVAFPNAISFESAKRHIGTKAHIEVSKDLKASVLYCKKEETRIGKIYTNSKRFDTLTQKKMKKKNFEVVETPELHKKWIEELFNDPKFVEGIKNLKF